MLFAVLGRGVVMTRSRHLPFKQGKRVNRGAGYGLEIPCEYCFTGDEFSIQWLKSKLEEQGFL